MARRKKLYDPSDPEPFPISRTKIDLYVQCPRCFYMDRRLGIGRPSGPPFLLNSAVDQLFKNEFDAYREKGEAHPIMAETGRNLLPARHDDLSRWRHNFTGIRVHHDPTNFILFGAIDDLWQDQDTGEYLIADYKSTSKKDGITAENVCPGYWRQMEFYQYLVRGLGYEVSPQGYLVYANGDKSRASFEGKLHFDVSLVTKLCDDSWVEPVVRRAHAALQQSELPPANESCVYCQYRAA